MGSSLLVFDKKRFADENAFKCASEMRLITVIACTWYELANGVRRKRKCE